MFAVFENAVQYVYRNKMIGIEIKNDAFIYKFLPFIMMFKYYFTSTLPVCKGFRTGKV